MPLRINVFNFVATKSNQSDRVETHIEILKGQFCFFFLNDYTCWSLPYINQIIIWVADKSHLFVSARVQLIMWLNLNVQRHAWNCSVQSEFCLQVSVSFFFFYIISKKKKFTLKTQISNDSIWLWLIAKLISSLVSSQYYSINIA